MGCCHGVRCVAIGVQARERACFGWGGKGQKREGTESQLASPWNHEYHDPYHAKNNNKMKVMGELGGEE